MVVIFSLLPNYELSVRLGSCLVCLRVLGQSFNLGSHAAGTGARLHKAQSLHGFSCCIAWAWSLYYANPWDLQSPPQLGQLFR